MHNRVYKENDKIALYGLGTETERFIRENSNLEIVGLLDGFKTEGEMYGYPIISLSDVTLKDVKLIIVIARPGSCKVITKRIGQFCKDNNISLYDVRGKNLLEQISISYDFKNINGYTKKDILDKVQNVDVVSFDLFDTLVARTVYSYTDIFELVDMRLEEKKIEISDFPKRRLQSEKELSKTSSPSLVQIYDDVLKQTSCTLITSDELASLEWDIDFSCIVPRKEMCRLIEDLISSGKKVIITTDLYYSEKQVCDILEKVGIIGLDKVFVSSKYGTFKTQNLYEVVKESYSGCRILHIGDDSYADIDKAIEHSIDSFKIYSGFELLDGLGGLGLDESISSLTDRVKAGLFISEVFNSPFVFEDEDRVLSISSSYDVGNVFCAPMISDFIYWLDRVSKNEDYKQILFCSRDGYLPIKLFDKISTQTRSHYFLASRTAAIRAGMENEKDIGYVDSMKYFGSEDEALKNRFGICLSDNDSDRNDAILSKSSVLRENYKKYIREFDFSEGNIGMFDFVAKGTTQLYLQKLFTQHMKGFYFLQLEPDFMSDKGLEIEPFYTEEEKNESAIFENYYILETILTAPHPQVLEFNELGRPVYAEETRNSRDLNTFEKAQKGIMEYFDRISDLIPAEYYCENKKLDEQILALINKIKIFDEDFMSLTVEDPFFGRMTDIKDVIG